MQHKITEEMVLDVNAYKFSYHKMCLRVGKVHMLFCIVFNKTYNFRIVTLIYDFFSFGNSSYNVLGDGTDGRYNSTCHYNSRIYF